MTGVYYAAAELSSKGYLVTVTSRSAPAVDMLVSTPDLKRTYEIQVKTNKANTNFWLLSKEAKKRISPNLVYIFVNLKREGKPDFYLATSRTVSANMAINRRRNSVFYWFPRENRYRDKWDILK
jgi:hypothetical protein